MNLCVSHPNHELVCIRWNPALRASRGHGLAGFFLNCLLLIRLQGRPFGGGVHHRKWRICYKILRYHNSNSLFSCEIMLVRKLKDGDRYRIAIVPRCSPPRRGSPRGAWLWIRVLRQRKRKIQPLMGVKGACPLMDCLPTGGRRVGVTLAISTPVLKNSRGIF